MKISKQTINDLLILIEHAKKDMGYRGVGTYSKPGLDWNSDYEFDERSAKRAERAIEFIKELIIL